MSLADDWMHYTHNLSCSMHSDLWRGEQHEGEEGENGTKEQPHNATQCHLQMNGCIILTNCHVQCIPSCEGENNMRGGRRKQQLKNNHTMQRNVTCRWMDALYSLPVMYNAFTVVKGRTTWGGGRRKRQLNNNHTMQCNVICRWMDALYSPPGIFHAFTVVKGRTTWGGGRRKQQVNNNHTLVTQCHLQISGCIMLTGCHVQCIHSCEGKNNMRGRKERMATKEQPHNAT